MNNYNFKEDKILLMFFQQKRWEDAIKKGVFKGVNEDDLYYLTSPEMRIKMLRDVINDNYDISVPHTANIPKPASPGEFRTVYVNEPIDRIFLPIANDLAFELCPEMVHKNCKSYQKGIGCGKVVQECSRRIESAKGNVIGWKSDLSKYFDSVPIRFIDEILDKIEQKHGYSKIIEIIRRYYHSDYYFDNDNVLQKKYQSLKQGCAFAAFLADALLYHIDEKLTDNFGCFYVRYSDDMLCIGRNYPDAMQCLERELEKMEMKLNPKKVEYLSSENWFRFLGFSIKGKNISLSEDSIKIFQKEIEKRTIKSDSNFEQAIRAVNSYLYRGNGKYSWSTRILPIVNVTNDIKILNNFVLDCLRAVKTGKKKLYGLGYVKTKAVGCIMNGNGRNVRSNRDKTDRIIPDFKSLGCMQKAMQININLYYSLVSNLVA